MEIERRGWISTWGYENILELFVEMVAELYKYTI